jgi:superfamily II DNA/RNA helicase
MKCEGIGIGRSLGQEKEKMVEGVDILVGGMHRFQQMSKRRDLFVSNLSWIVIDEVDTIVEGQKNGIETFIENIIQPKLNHENPLKIILSSTTNPRILK